ncbi:MAG: hypothetical protein P8N02_19960, partial [Actinomycetota bacterium]|nr:hypothetical protein [Actinomycetota bacterium]
MALDPERRRQLHGLKLRALVEEHLDGTLTDVTGTDDGAIAVLTLASGEPTVAALAEERAVRGLGGALAAAHRAKASDVHIFATDHAGVLARRAQLFTRPPTVWTLDGRVAGPARPDPTQAPPSPPEVPELVALLEVAGVDVVVEHGVVIGEVQGLEVARVVPSDTGHQLEVGVGAHDREAFGMLHGDLPTPDAIRQVAEVVRTHRQPGASPHPLNRLGAERWLRARLIDRPSVVGAESLTHAPPPVVRRSLKEPVPAVAHGVDASGAPIVVVTSVG